MYRFYLNKISNDYHYAELIRSFIPDDKFEAITIDWNTNAVDLLGNNSFLINADGSDDRDCIKRELLGILSEITGRTSEWGTLTGVRPLKLAKQIYSVDKNINSVRKELADRYLISEDKINLLTEILDYQLKYVEEVGNSDGLYIGIPFCPTRCAYCSFAANVAESDEIQAYIDKLEKEINFTAELAAKNGTVFESVYMGGGTPTSITASQLDRLLSTIEYAFGIKPAEIEFTVEAGRPDTINEAKLDVLRQHNISRISINPQTMKDETLVKIGRRHNAQDIINAYKLADEYGFETVNADIIAGLPDETLDDFKKSLDKVIELGADNITVHTLSVKKGSRLRDENPEYYRTQGEVVADMLEYSRNKLKSAGFYPYYIYRQKHQIGFFENVGYCRAGKHSLYNIRIMEEKQTIIALGAGGIGKLYFPDEDRLERIANVSNYKIYIERFEEMLERKNKYYGGQ